MKTAISKILHQISVILPICIEEIKEDPLGFVSQDTWASSLVVPPPNFSMITEYDWVDFLFIVFIRLQSFAIIWTIITDSDGAD